MFVSSVVSGVCVWDCECVCVGVFDSVCVKRTIDCLLHIHSFTFIIKMMEHRHSHSSEMNMFRVWTPLLTLHPHSSLSLTPVQHGSRRRIFPQRSPFLDNTWGNASNASNRPSLNLPLLSWVCQRLWRTCKSKSTRKNVLTKLSTDCGIPQQTLNFRLGGASSVKTEVLLQRDCTCWSRFDP